MPSFVAPAALAPLRVVATRNGRVQLHRVGDRVLLTAGPSIAEVNGDEIVRNPEWMRGLDAYGDDVNVTIVGAWPNDAYYFATAREPYASLSPRNRLWRRRDGRWASMMSGDNTPYGVAAWGPRALAFEMTEGAWRFRSLTANTESQPQSVPIFPAQTCLPTLMRAAASGDIFGAASQCSGDKPSVAMLWRAGESASTITPLPNSHECGPPTVQTMHVYDATNVYVGGSARCITHMQPYLARFDGASWSTYVTGPDSDVSGTILNAVARAGDGSLYTLVATGTRTSSGKIWRRFADGHYAEIPIPNSDPKHPLEPLAILVPTPDDVWIVAGHYDDHVSSSAIACTVFRTGGSPTKSVMRFPDANEITAEQTKLGSKPPTPPPGYQP